MEIKLSGSRYEEIKRIVVNLFVRYNISSVPMNSLELASKMGIAVIAYSEIPENRRRLLIKKSNDGFCVEKDEGEWYIFYNDNKNKRRINNTIMHEIGHIVLDHSEDSELAEKEVKFFAKYALAPPVLIHKLQLDAAEEISQTFDISFEAASYAYKYYQKWLNYGEQDYTDYEIIILDLFNEAI